MDKYDWIALIGAVVITVILSFLIVYGNVGERLEDFCANNNFENVKVITLQGSRGSSSSVYFCDNKGLLKQVYLRECKEEKGFCWSFEK